ncbi:hypothetical protein ABPG74_009922 [Tetrahymena malaccensis]
MEQYVELLGYQLTHEQYQNVTVREQEFQQLLQIVNDQYSKKGSIHFQKIRHQLKSQLTSLQQLVKLDEYGQKKLSNALLQQSYIDVSKNYPFMLKIRGDGNCFYRAVIIGILLTIIQSNKNEFLRILIRTVFHIEKFVFQLKDEITGISETDIGIILIKFFTQILIQKEINEKFSILQLFAEINDFPEIDLSLNIFCRNMLNSYFQKSLNDPQYNQFIGDDMKTKIPFQLCVIGEEAEDVIIPLSANAFQYKIVIQNLYIDKSDKAYTDQIVYNPTQGESADSIILCYSQGHYDLLLSQNQSQIFKDYPQIILSSKFVLGVTKQQRMLKDDLIESELQQEEERVRESERHQQEIQKQEKKASESPKNKQNICQQIVEKFKRVIQKGKTKKVKEMEKANSKENDSLTINTKKSDNKKNLNFYQRLNSKKKNNEKSTQQKGTQKCLECLNQFISNSGGEEELDSVFLCDNCYQLQSNKLNERDNSKKKQDGDASKICQICEKETDQDKNFNSQGICKECIKMQILSNYKQSDCISCKKEAQFQIESQVYNNFKLGICQECVKENFLLIKEQEEKIETLRVYLKDLSTYINFQVDEKIQNFILTLSNANRDAMLIEINQPKCSFCLQVGDQFLYEAGNPKQLICLECFKSQEYRQMQESLQEEQIQQILWDIVNQQSIPSCFICFDPLNESENNIKIQDIIRDSSIQICLKCQKEGIFVFDQDDNISAFSSYLNHPLNIIPREEDKKYLKSVLQNNLN